MGRRRLDAELVRRGLAASRSQAQAAVDAGRVTVAGIKATKAASLVADDAPVALSASPRPFASRGGGKLAAALDRFAVDPGGMDRTNVRDLIPSILACVPDLVVADLSFISLRLTLPTLAAVAAPGATFVVLVKPQFEAGRGQVGRGGVVRDPDVWRRALSGVIATARSVSLEPLNVMASPLPGPAGNVEFPLHLVAGSSGSAVDLEAAVREGEGLRR